MAETNNTTSNTTADETNKVGSSKPSKKLKSSKVNDEISKKGLTISGDKPDQININPVQENAEHTAVTNLNMRAQPPHKGHGEVIKAVEDEAKRVGGSAHIITSHSEGDDKNPIPAKKKVEYLKKMASPGTHVSHTTREAPSVIDTAARLNKHAHHLVVVAGSDRADEYEKLLHRYNGKPDKTGKVHFNFKSITVKKIDRDPDAEGTKGVSGTKMREHAKSGNIGGFKSGLPPELHQHAEEMMNDINRASKKKMKEDIDDLFDSRFIDTDDTPAVMEAITNALFEKMFGKYREAVPRSTKQKRDEIDLVPRKGEDRKMDDRFYRHQSLKKKILEAYGKKYKSPWDKVEKAKPGIGKRIDDAASALKKNADDYQKILDAEKKKKANEEFEQIDEISKELVGKVNKLRTLGPDIIKGTPPKPHKTKAGYETLKKAVDKAGGVKRVKEEASSEIEEEKRGLWANIWARRRAGKRMRKPGEKGAPTAAALKAAQESVEIDEAAESGLAAKAKKSGVSIATLRKVYRRGVAAWNSGHRPGTTPQQWGMARVNSYIAKGKGTYGGADKDLHEDHEEVEENYAADNKKYHAGLSKSTAKARVAHWKKMAKYSDRDPRAYQPAPGDATAKTKPSKYTIAYHKKYGD